MMQIKKKNVVVLGLSGGVDSAVSCYLLIKHGYQVIPVFMQNWDAFLNNDIAGHLNNFTNGCESNADYAIAKKVASHFGLKIHKIQFINEYWEKVFKYFIKQYKKSLTPNPDILCNKYIKFNSFIKYAKSNFNCDYIATGHYAKIKKTKHGLFLQQPKDLMKDQTYFLANLNKKQLENVIFPLANITKKEVRLIAKKIKLPNWNRKDSTGICFIGERKFQKFLTNYIPIKTGNIIDIVTKKVLGNHIGTMYYTLGQNKGLHLSGVDTKYFICRKDIKNNILYVCNSFNKNKYLLSNYAILNNFNFINKNIKLYDDKLYVRFRHLQQLIKVKLFSKEKNKYIIKYKPTLSVTPGQYAVLYQNKICIGCGEINKIFNYD